MAVFCSSLISCFPGVLLRYCLSDFEMVPSRPWYHFCFHIPHTLDFCYKVFKIFLTYLLITFLSPVIILLLLVVVVAIVVVVVVVVVLVLYRHYDRNTHTLFIIIIIIIIVNFMKHSGRYTWVCSLCCERKISHFAHTVYLCFV